LLAELPSHGIRDRIYWLRSLASFGQLDDASLTLLAEHARVRTFRKGDRMIVDLAGSSGPVKGALNCGAAQTVSMIRLAYKAMTKCAADKGAKGPYATFIDRLKEFSPQSAGKVSVSLASEFYDGVRLMEAAVKAIGKTSGPDVARWIETEGSKVPLIHGSVSPSATSHFLFGPNELSAVESPNKIGEDGLMTRSGC